MDIAKEVLQNKILIVDDVLSMRRLTKEILRDSGFTFVFEAQDGQEALLLMRKIKVNLVICDWNMPVMSGIEYFKALQTDSKLAKTPFILLTSSSEITKVKEAIEVGITSYVVKPYKPADLMKKIYSLLV
ncbi:MAG: response regulator [Methylococcales bacterium]|nr:response regulator [Methylococcales bacterium]